MAALRSVGLVQLYRVKGSPEYVHPAYLVYPRDADNGVLEQALGSLRELAERQSQ